MSDLDPQIRTAVVELLDASPPPPPFPRVEPTFDAQPPRRSRRVAVLALGLAIILIATGVVVAANQSDDEARVSTAPLPPATVLQCRGNLVGSDAAPGAGRTVVLRRVALSTGRALQAFPSNDEDPAAALFAKDGLLVRRSSRVELIVPTRWRSRLSLRWGDTPRTTRLRVEPCPADTLGGEWLAFAGGYFVNRPACVPLIVKSGTETQRVHIGVGMRCPGTRRLTAP